MEIKKEEMETLETNAEPTTEEATVEAEKPEESKDLQSALAQKEHFRTKLDEAKLALEEYKKSNPPKVEEAKTEVKAQPVSSDMLETVRLGKALNNYNEKETDWIIKNATTKDAQGILEAEKDVNVQAAITAMRAKVETEQSVSEPSGATLGGFKVKGAEDILKMSPEERKNYAEAFEKKASRGSGI